MSGCSGCRHYLGGAWDFCAQNLERECAEGAFEAWEMAENLMGMIGVCHCLANMTDGEIADFLEIDEARVAEHVRWIETWRERRDGEGIPAAGAGRRPAD